MQEFNLQKANQKRKRLKVKIQFEKENLQEGLKKRQSTLKTVKIMHKYDNFLTKVN